MRLETVKVVAENDSGFIVINKSDLKPEHKVFAEKSRPASEDSVADSNTDAPSKPSKASDKGKAKG